MHLLRSPLLLAATLLPQTLAQQVVFTSPDLDKPVDLTKNVTIAWEVRDYAPEKLEAQVDIWWQGNKGEFGYVLDANLSNAPVDRQFVWDPSGIVQALGGGTVSVLKGKAHTFHLNFHNESSFRGSGITSKEFAVVGPSSLRMSAAGRAVVGGWAAAAGAVAAGVGVLMI